MMETGRYVVLDDDVTLTAGAADHTSEVWKIPERSAVWWERDLAVLIMITNGATAPTVTAKSQVQISVDGTNYYDFSSQIEGSSSSNGVKTAVITGIPKGAKYLKVVSGSNTDQDVTLRVEGCCGV